MSMGGLGADLPCPQPCCCDPCLVNSLPVVLHLPDQLWAVRLRLLLVLPLWVEKVVALLQKPHHSSIAPAAGSWEAGFSARCCLFCVAYLTRL